MISHIHRLDKTKGGIYVIRNSINSLIYIGSTNNFTRRMTRHKSSLKCNKHDNTHLQRFDISIGRIYQIKNYE